MYINYADYPLCDVCVCVETRFGQSRQDAEQDDDNRQLLETDEGDISNNDSSASAPQAARNWKSTHKLK